MSCSLRVPWWDEFVRLTMNMEFVMQTFLEENNDEARDFGDGRTL